MPTARDTSTTGNAPASEGHCDAAPGERAPPAAHGAETEWHHALPLSERASGAVAGAVSEEEIRTLVETFYDAARRDELLGPVFDRHVTDWPLHLQRIHDFWSTVVRRSGRYSGRPIEAHQALPGLDAAHFDRWLELWERTLSETIASPEARRAFTIAARRMADATIAQLRRTPG